LRLTDNTYHQGQEMAKSRDNIGQGSVVLSPFGNVLRQWRSVRRMSQLDLALEAEVSARHVSFLETGRSQPSREMVLRLADGLDIPLRERNTLLEAAGLARIYHETALSSPEMDHLRHVIELILERQEPYSAVAIDRFWNIILANGAHERILGALLGPDPLPRVSTNLLRLVFDPSGLRSYIVNWSEVAQAVLHRLHREFGANPNDESRKLLEEVHSYPEIPERWRYPDFTSPPSILLPVHIRKDRFEAKLFSLITMVGTPQDVTLQELRIESFFPADPPSDKAIRAITAR